MRAIVQRVTRASVSWGAPAHGEHVPRAEWEGENRSEIGPGLAVLVGAGPGDDAATADRLADKVALLRIFPDEQGRFNRSLEDVGGEALVVSQFTLYADVTRGRRPGFSGAAAPEKARELCRRFANRLAERGITTRSGSFGAHMEVSLVNDGPVTLAVSTEPWETRIGV